VQDGRSGARGRPTRLRLSGGVEAMALLTNASFLRHRHAHDGFEVEATALG
jgi:hypothetical protein